MTRLRFPLKTIAFAAALVAGPAFATDGYFPHGYGIRAKGMGGASVAMTQDSMGIAALPEHAQARLRGIGMRGRDDVAAEHRHALAGVTGTPVEGRSHREVSV